MFKEKLKSQYWFWCAFAGGLLLARIIENIVAFDVVRLLINVFFVLVGAFVLYCVVYPFTALFRYFKHKSMGIFLLLVTCAFCFNVPVQESEAKWGKVVKGAAIAAASYIGGKSMENKVSDAIRAGEDALYDAVYGTAAKIWKAVKNECPRCGTPGAKHYHSGSGISNCPARSPYPPL